MRLHPIILAAAIAVSSAAFAHSAVAQSAQGATVGGVVRDSLRAPISGAEILLLEIRRTERTDSLGRFRFHGVPAGSYHVVIRHPAFHPLDGTVVVAEGDSLELPLPRMRRTVSALDTVHVVDTASSRVWWMHDFEQRRASVHGTFITSKELSERASWSLPNIVGALTPGVRIIHRVCGGTDCGWTLASSKPAACLSLRCPPQPVCLLAVWLDGQPLSPPGDPPDLSQFAPEQLAAAEVYTDIPSIPPEFNVTGSSCGVLALWTRTDVQRK